VPILFLQSAESDVSLSVETLDAFLKLCVVIIVSILVSSQLEMTRIDAKGRLVISVLLGIVAASFSPRLFWAVLLVYFIGLLSMFGTFFIVYLSIRAGNILSNYVKDKLRHTKVVGVVTAILTVLSVYSTVITIFQTARVFELHLMVLDLVHQGWAHIGQQAPPPPDWFFNFATPATEASFAPLREMFLRCWAIIEISLMSILPLSFSFGCVRSHQ